ncbi:MAG: hypothetical protein SNJ73_05720 [Acetobacteraceae bacterium]
MRDIQGGAHEVARFILVTLRLVVLGLLAVLTAAARLSRRQAGRFGTDAVALAAEIAGPLRTFMLARGAMTALTDLAVWPSCRGLGLEPSRAWAAIAGVPSFAAFISSFVASLL